MATSFPTGLDALTNPTASDALDTPGVLHDEQHANANDAIEAIEAKVGVNGSAVTSSLDYKMANHTHTALPSVDVDTLRIKASNGTYVNVKILFQGGVYNIQIGQPT